MVILGIDPGLAIVGYGVIRTQNNRFEALDYGTLRSPANTPSPVRLNLLFNAMAALLETYKPDCISFEELFFYSNITTAMSVSQARGVLVLAAERCGLPLYEFTPMQIKQAVTGYGHADKLQVQSMVKTLLNLKETPKPDDAADALAAAICLANAMGPLAGQYAMK